MIKKRAVAFVMLTVMGFMIFTGSFTQRLLAAENLMTYEQYKAYHYLNYSMYDYLMSSDFIPAYRTIVEENRDPVYQVLINAWEVATFDLSKVTDYSKKRIGYYEAFLFDILYTGYEPENLNGAISQTVKSIQASSLEEISEMMEESAVSCAKMNLADMSPEELDNLTKLLNQCDGIQKVFGEIDDVSKVFKCASNVEELLYKLSKVEAIRHISGDNAEVLRKVAANTEDASLAAACLGMADICDGQLSQEEIIALLGGDMAATEMTNWALGEIWKGVVEELTGCGIAISAGQSLGKWAAHLLFSTDKQVETYYEMCALYDFENELRKVVSSYANQGYGTQEKARLYNTSFELLLKMLQLGCDMAVDYTAANYDSGAVNLFVSYASGDHEKFEQYKKSLENIKKSLGLVYIYANGDLYNSYRDYCQDAADALEMEKEPANAAPENVQNTLQILRQETARCSNIKVKEGREMTLMQDTETYGALYLTGGTLNLNGHTLKAGCVYQAGGKMRINRGTLEVSGDYIIAKEGKDSETGEPEYQMTYTAVLEMSKDADTIKVGKDFYINAYSGYDSRDRLFNVFTAGTIMVGGNFIAESFVAGQDHTVILNGTGKQKIITGEESGLGTLSVSDNYKGEITIDGRFWCSRLGTGIEAKSEAAKINNLNLNGKQLKIVGDMEIAGNVDLAGGTLSVNGNVNQTGGKMKINRGTFEISGDYIMAKEGENGETDESEYQITNAVLQMSEDADTIKVGKNFYMCAPYSSYVDRNNDNIFTAGTMTVGGNFTVEDSSNGYSKSFRAEESHTVILNGTGKQRISFASTRSQFGNLSVADNYKGEITIAGLFGCRSLEKGIEVKSDSVKIDRLNLNGNQMKIAGDIEITGNVDLAGGTLSVNGNMNQTDGTVEINGGTLDISGNYILAKEEKNSETGEPEYQIAHTTLKMLGDADTIKVGKDFYICTSFSYNFRAGVMMVGGDFTQDGSSGSFCTHDSHMVILNGKEHQNITFNGSDSHFNILKLTKNRKTGYTFSPDNCWKKLIDASEEIPHEHTVVVDEAIEPTCTKNGLTEGTHCSECMEVLKKQKVVKALGHDYVDGVCSRCGGQETKEQAFKKGQALTDKKTGAVYKVTSAKDKEETVEFTKTSNSKATNVSVPSTVRFSGTSFKVTGIAANAFKNNKKITKVTIGSNITSIGANAFLNCISLKTVTIPSKVKKIGKQAFYGCQKLTAITIKAKKLVSKNVGDKAFAKLNQKAVVKVPAACLKTYKKLLQQKGLTGKKQKVQK